MKLDLAHTDKESLVRLGQQASELLVNGEFSELAQLFGYALAFDRDPTSALEADLGKCLAEATVVAESWSGEKVRVKCLAPNGSNLVAVVECVCLVSQRFPVLLELIVSRGSDGAHIMIEDLSPA